MIDIKQKLLEELLSTPLDEYLDRAVPVGAILIPEEVGNNIGAAQIACGVYARNMCIYLKAWEGIPLLLVALYTGNHVQSAQGQLLASIEKYKDPKEHDLSPIKPVESQTFAVEEEIKFAAEITGVDDCTGVYCYVSGPANTSMELFPVGGFKYESKDGYGFQTAGSYTATFHGWFGNYHVQKIVHFEVI